MSIKKEKEISVSNSRGKKIFFVLFAIVSVSSVMAIIGRVFRKK